MTIRVIDLGADYEMLCVWWQTRGLPIVPKVILSGAHGVIAQAGGRDVAAGWVYFDERNIIGLVEWITTNPAVGPSPELTEALSRILGFFEYDAKERQCHNLFTFVAKDTGLHRSLVRSGWQDPKSEPHIFLFKSFA